MTDRQPESVTAPPKCDCGFHTSASAARCSNSPSPAPEAPPEWVMKAAWAVWRLSSQTLGNQAAILGAIANGILAAYLASEEARKMERLEKALRELVAANEQWNSDVEKVIGRVPGWSDAYLDAARAALASPLVEETHNTAMESSDDD